MSKSYNIDGWFKKHKVWSGIIIFIVFVIVVSPFISNSDGNEETAESTDFSSQNNDIAPQAIEEQKPEYSEITKIDITPIRQERHYVWNQEKPSEERVKNLMLELRKNCPEDKICDFMLWESQAAYNQRNDDSNLFDEYLTNNKINLIGYLNSGGLFYYYGSEEVDIL